MNGGGGVCFQIHSGISFIAVWHFRKEIWYHMRSCKQSHFEGSAFSPVLLSPALDDYNHLINDEFHWIWRMVSPYSGAISLSEINRIKKEETGDFDGVLHHLTQTLLLHPKKSPKVCSLLIPFFKLIIYLGPLSYKMIAWWTIISSMQSETTKVIHFFCVFPVKSQFMTFSFTITIVVFIYNT